MEKMVMTGNNHMIEKDYERIVAVNQGGYRPAQGQGKYHEKNLVLTQKKRKRIVMELILNNFTDLESCFISLTFNDEKDKRYMNLTLCHKEFNKFIRNMRRTYPSLKYVVVFARQTETDNWHYHMICDQQFVDSKMILKWWKNGSINIKSVYRVTGIAEYLSNHYQTTFASYDAGYKKSQGLKRFIKYRTWNSEESQLCEALSTSLISQKIIHEFHTTSEYCGSYSYKVYLIEHDQTPNNF